jgi:catechol 2,3-dioxygenase-like lactoylglutathione lyase family enzyme
VPDVERAKTFYTGVFGWQVLGEGADPARRFALLGDGGRVVLTLWEQSTGRFSTERPGLHHLSFEVESIEQVEEAAARARQLGATPIYDGIVPHAEGASSGGAFFEDPDGIRLEVYAPSGADAFNPAPSGAAPSCGFF